MVEVPLGTMAAGLTPAIVLLLFAHVLLSCFSPAKPDLQSDKLTLLAFRDAVGRSALDWNASLSPCLWTGIVCETDRGVSAVLLSGVGLLGEMPDGSLINLTALRTLNLGFNSLSGSLPRDLAAIAKLQNISLQNNHFSDEIPSSISSIQNLVQLNLAGNMLSGGIPSDIRNLKLLRFLYLEENELTGGIPDFNLSFEQFNVSYNRLKGPIPPSLRTMPVGAFLGLDVCGSPLSPCPDDNGAPTPPLFFSVDFRQVGSKLSWIAIVGIVIGSLVGLLFLLLLFCFVWLLLACYFLIRSNTPVSLAGASPATSEAEDESGFGDGNRSPAGGLSGEEHTAVEIKLLAVPGENSATTVSF